MLNLRKVGDNSHVPAVWFAAEPEDKRSNIRFVFYQEGIDMAAKKGASKTTAKTTVQTPVKTAEEVTSAQTAKKVVANEKATEKKEEVKPAKVEAIETKAGKAKAIETKKDTTKAIETRAAVLQESEPAAEEKKIRARKTSAKTTTAAKTAVPAAAVPEKRIGPWPHPPPAGTAGRAENRSPAGTWPPRTARLRRRTAAGAGG